MCREQYTRVITSGGEILNFGQRIRHVFEGKKIRKNKNKRGWLFFNLVFIF
jgi:hypothetical protein